MVKGEFWMPAGIDYGCSGSKDDAQTIYETLMPPNAADHDS